MKPDKTKENVYGHNSVSEQFFLARLPPDENQKITGYQ